MAGMRAVVKDVHDPVKAAAALKALPKDYKEVDRQAYHWANVILERFDEDTAMKASRVRTHTGGSGSNYKRKGAYDVKGVRHESRSAVKGAYDVKWVRHDL
eukprot:1576780-Pyramimonas_sp.AAC.1